MSQAPVTLPIANSQDAYTVAPTKIIALGLNYKDHIAESHTVKVRGFTKEIPSEPLLFPKTPNVLIGPGDPIVIPKFIGQYDFDEIRVDYEAELAVIIKAQCKDLSEESVFDHILGYTCMNDVSQRNIQHKDRTGWFRGKSLDTFGPIGPRVVLQKDIGDPQALDIECRLNGKQVQHSNTRHMIFPIPEIVAFVSKNFTLEAGDIILTGTPAGVGKIAHQDKVAVTIEKIGTLENPVIDETAA